MFSTLSSSECTATVSEKTNVSVLSHLHSYNFANTPILLKNFGHVSFICTRTCLCTPQDPKTIKHQQAASGDEYAMPEKKEKKGSKKGEPVSDEQIAQIYSTVDKTQKHKSQGVS